MENASKALLMAGGILIALLILGALIMMFTSLQDYQNTNDAQTKNSQIAQFNNQFEPYNKDGKTIIPGTAGQRGRTAKKRFCHCAGSSCAMPCFCCF